MILTHIMKQVLVGYVTFLLFVRIDSLKVYIYIDIFKTRYVDLSNLY